MALEQTIQAVLSELWSWFNRRQLARAMQHELVKSIVTLLFFLARSEGARKAAAAPRNRLVACCNLQSRLNCESVRAAERERERDSELSNRLLHESEPSLAVVLPLPRLPQTSERREALRRTQMEKTGPIQSTCSHHHHHHHRLHHLHWPARQSNQIKSSQIEPLDSLPSLSVSHSLPGPTLAASRRHIMQSN